MQIKDDPRDRAWVSPHSDLTNEWIVNSDPSARQSATYLSPRQIQVQAFRVRQMPHAVLDFTREIDHHLTVVILRSSAHAQHLNLGRFGCRMWLRRRGTRNI